MGKYFVTGAAALYRFARHRKNLIKDGHTVVGVDNMNDAYDVRMKEYRLRNLQDLSGFTFHRLDISDKSILDKFKTDKFDAVINLAARAGVRSSVENPWVYLESNVTGMLNMLELCRVTHAEIPLASTSSIYGAKPPFPRPKLHPATRRSSPMQPAKRARKRWRMPTIISTTLILVWCVISLSMVRREGLIWRFFASHNGSVRAARCRSTEMENNRAVSPIWTTSRAVLSRRSSRLVMKLSTWVGTKLSPLMT